MVIVDVLSFSSAVITAVHHGGIIYPCAEAEDATEFAERIGGKAAVRRPEVPGMGRFSLSPLTYLKIKTGTRVVLPSPNGATCSRQSMNAPYVFVGALLNASAVAAAVSKLLDETNLCVTVVACGEKEATTGVLRMAVEDYLGAGTILWCIHHQKSVEALVCEGAFLHSREQIVGAIWDCESGRELHDCGFDNDVKFVSCLDRYNSVPILRGEYYELSK